ncbi:MAG: tRNA (N6-isopentenyl adenosine(37)-C2)-methylthiotransferase MiaB, partial [Candidatus Brocadiia bacterium]
MNDASPRVCIVTFGCQMNRLDSEILRGELSRAGFGLAEEPEAADVVLYNTCSVRDHAEQKVFSHLGSYRRRAETDPEFVLGVIGCMAQRLAEDIVERFPFVDVVCGTRAFLRVPGYVREVLEGGGPIVDVRENDASARVEFDRAACMRQEGHSAYVSVMRGCDNFCAYCIVPFVRGREYSRQPADVVEEVRALVGEGVREVTLLGQNVNSYGRGLEPPAGLADLLEQTSKVGGIERIRFVTSHPRDMSDEILRAVGELDKVCEHLHVPPQSGSDVVLDRMRRGYTAAEYRDMVQRARQLIPGVMLAGDFIVGFPGETKDDFQRTLELLQEVRYQQSFIFKYSPRPGTLAARWQDDVPEEVKRERNQV